MTQPRRVAAIASAGRVAAEMGSELGDVVGYQVIASLQLASLGVRADLPSDVMLVVRACKLPCNQILERSHKLPFFEKEQYQVATFAGAL